MTGGFANIPLPVGAIDEKDRDAILAAIDPDEIVKLALDLGNIRSFAGQEAEAAAFVHDWMKQEGFKPRKVGATPERPNVIGIYGGRGEGKNLLFTAHLDTESPTWNPALDPYKFLPATLDNPEWTQCWLEDGRLFGYPIANDRGPMSCFLMAAKALKKAGYDLAGKLYLTACPGEIGPEPMEEHEGVAFLGKDIGAHYLFHHGGVAPDYAIAAEGCDFGLTWVGCGYAVFRLKIAGEAIFTPLVNHPEDPNAHPNPIYRLGAVIAALNSWGRDYEVRHVYESPGGVSHPKTQIAAVRGGIPYDFGAGSEVCCLYLEVGMTAQQTVASIQHDLERLVRVHNLGDIEIESLVVRNGFEADAEAVAPLVGAVDAATRLGLGKPLQRANPVYSSMWRDHNVFNMQRVPAVTTGMTRWRPTPQDLVDSALIYALTALAVCGRADSTGSERVAAPIYGDNPFSSN